MLRKRLFYAGLAAMSLGLVGVALGTPPFGVIPGIPERGTIDGKFKVKSGLVELKTKGSIDVVQQTITLQPGGHSGWHGHAGPALVIVKSGTVTSYEADDPTCTPHVYTAGDAFVDYGAGHIARNEGATPAEVTFTILLPVGAAPRDDLDDPGFCD
jgi:quercetin dioxygenase-like cupin family protein